VAVKINDSPSSTLRDTSVVLSEISASACPDEDPVDDVSASGFGSLGVLAVCGVLDDVFEVHPEDIRITAQIAVKPKLFILEDIQSTVLIDIKKDIIRCQCTIWMS
jgi:hypothetical protein